MKILYCHQHFSTPYGAGGIRSYEMARALVEAGHEVTMVFGMHPRVGIALQKCERSGVHSGEVDGIRLIGLPFGYTNKLSIRQRIGIFLGFAWHSLRIALREEYDLIFATSTPLTAAIPGIAARWFRRKPFVFEVRDLWPELPRAMGMKNPLLLGGMWILEGLAYRSSIGCIGLSPGIVEGIIRRSPEAHPVAMVPNGCDLDIFHPALRAPITIPGIAPGDFVAGFTGAHGRANGLDAVLAGAAELKKRGSHHIKFLLIGDGSEKARLMAQAEAEALKNVIFLPSMPKKELAAITASLGCGLMFLDNIPAFYRGTSPNKFFDYLAAGIPVVNNYPGWLAELITEAQCGAVVPPGDPVALADVLERLASDPEGCRSMGAHARKLGESHFSRDALATKFREFLEGIAGVNNPSRHE
jgi:glycosyltransferase involved in cell wall biosynthesis